MSLKVSAVQCAVIRKSAVVCSIFKGECSPGLSVTEISKASSVDMSVTRLKAAEWVMPKGGVMIEL